MPDIAFVAVDWGTTHFRAWSIDRSGAPMVARQSDQGMHAVKPYEYAAILDNQLSHLGAVLALAGLTMVGAQVWPNRMMTAAQREMA